MKLVNNAIKIQHRLENSNIFLTYDLAKQTVLIEKIEGDEENKLGYVTDLNLTVAETFAIMVALKRFTELYLCQSTLEKNLKDSGKDKLWAGMIVILGRLIQPLRILFFRASLDLKN